MPQYLNRLCPRLPRLATLVFATVGSVVACLGLCLISDRSSAAVDASVQYLRCRTDGEIPADKRKAAEQAGLHLVEAILSGNEDAAYGLLSEEARQAVPRDAFGDFAARAVRPLTDKPTARVTQTQFIELSGSLRPTTTQCGHLDAPANWVTVAVAAVAEQAYVLVEVDGKNNTWTFVIWLTADRDWRVRHVDFLMSAIVGRTAKDFQAMASEQLERGHRFNAALLYSAAAQLADRGANYELGILREIRSALSKVDLPADLQGGVPFEWRLPSGDYRVTNMSPLGVAGKIYLSVAHEIPPWASDEDVDQANRRFIADLKEAIPEYSDAFSGIVVRAFERGGNRSYGTVATP